MSVYWLEQSVADVPVGDAWLGPTELPTLERFRFAKRREEWRLGRWTAKLCTAAYLETPRAFDDFARIEIRSTTSGAPIVLIAGQSPSFTISLSHRAGQAMCVVSPSGSEVGCDLELIEPRGPEFVSDYFTSDEQALVHQATPGMRPVLVTLLWSGKESALKAMHLGLSVDTRSVTAYPLRNDRSQQHYNPIQLTIPNPSASEPASLEWHPLEVQIMNKPEFMGWWAVSDTLVRTVVVRKNSCSSKMQPSLTGNT